MSALATSHHDLDIGRRPSHPLVTLAIVPERHADDTAPAQQRQRRLHGFMDLVAQAGFVVSRLGQQAGVIGRQHEHQAAGHIGVVAAQGRANDTLSGASSDLSSATMSA